MDLLLHNLNYILTKIRFTIPPKKLNKLFFKRLCQGSDNFNWNQHQDFYMILYTFIFLLSSYLLVFIFYTCKLDKWSSMFFSTLLVVRTTKKIGNRWIRLILEVINLFMF